MANQGSDRRAVLEMLAKAAAASQFPGFTRWAFGQQHQHAPASAPIPTAPYRPAYFSTSEYRAIEILTDLIIPKDETPGALEAGVAEFIDLLAAHGEKQLRQPMRSGLEWLDATAAGRYGANFVSLSPDRQTAILSSVAYPDPAAQPDREGRAFFRLMRRYAVMGYYTSRIGLAELDDPGLRFYTESPACPHTSDPEHRHLPPPRV
jgi:gluconate 2-dehydrogenase gamma chain